MTTANNLRSIALQAYIYAYPMVLMEITRRVSTNVEAPTGFYAPMNQFAHMRAFPDHTFTDVVRANVDTLYSAVWLDVSKEPVVLSATDTGGRYYMLPMLDMWTDVFAVPGSRTTGTGAANFAIVGPTWQGDLPDDVELIRCPTSMGWMIGRTQTNGAADYETVHQIQNGYQITPLSQWGQAYTPPKVTVNATWDTKTPPPVQVDRMTAQTYFELFAELLKANPPQEMDWNMVKLLLQLGIVAGETLNFASLPTATQQALEQATAAAPKLILHKKAGERINGWDIAREVMGDYGTSYLQRAYVARIGLGANVPEDAIYPLSVVDSAGHAYSGKHRYVLHFDSQQLPPVSGFWSVTMYNSEGYFVGNPIKRYAIGDRDPLVFNPDGSLDLYIQHESPGSDKEANWLPAAADAFNLVLRLYWPDMDILTGTWNPPPVNRVG